MKLQSNPHVQFVSQYPIGQCRRIKAPVHGREDHGASISQCVPRDGLTGELVIPSVNQDELYLVAGGEVLDVLPEIPIVLPASRTFEIEYPDHPRIDPGDIQRTIGLQQGLIPVLGQAAEKFRSLRVDQWLASGDFYQRGFKLTHGFQDLIHAHFPPAFLSVPRIAPGAPQIAPGKANHRATPSRSGAFTLDAQKYLADSQHFSDNGLLYKRWGLL